MPDVIIRGMERPATCSRCRLMCDKICYAIPETELQPGDIQTDKRPDWCPLRPAPEWISAEERLPEDFQKVLVFWWEHSEPMIDTAFWQKDAKRFDGEHWVRMEDKVTHWMPLPESPEVEA